MDTSISRYDLAVLIIFGAVLFRLFYHIWDEPLVRWDERTNREVLIELIQVPTFPDLTYRGDPFFEKPPLWYYLTGIPATIFGPSLTAIRMVSVLAGFSVIYLVWKVSLAWYGKVAGIVSLLALAATNQLFIKNAGGFFSSHTFRSADPDSLQIFFMLLTFICFRQASQKYILAGFVFAGLAVLTKGPFGLLPLGVYLLYVFRRGQLVSQIKKVLLGFCVCLLIVAPWYVYMVWKYDGLFTQAHFYYHLVARTLIPLEDHNEAWWFYVRLLLNPQVTIVFVPFAGCLYYLLTRAKGKISSYKTFAPALMTLSILIIATLVRTKLAWYILPLYPFAALVVGSAVQEVYNRTVVNKGGKKR